MQDKEIIEKWLSGLSKEQLAKQYKRQYNQEIKIIRSSVRNRHAGRFITQYEALSYVEKIIYKYLKRRQKMKDKYILDVCCGSKMFWFDKNNKNTVYMDNRELEDTLCDGRKLEIKPDIVADFRNIPFEDNSFYLVVFDPPHLKQIGETSYMAKKYGKLNEEWTKDLKQGFKECMRVLKTNGTLIFKWNEQQIKLKEILEIIDYKPLFGNRRDKTHWLVFTK